MIIKDFKMSYEKTIGNPLLLSMTSMCIIQIGRYHLFQISIPFLSAVDIVLRDGIIRSFTKAYFIKFTNFTNKSNVLKLYLF